MRTPGSVLLCTATILAFVSAGCAKRPAMVAASAPAPTVAPAPPPAPVTPPAPAPEPAAVTPSPPPGAAPARPAPADYAAGQLGDIHFDFDKATIRPDAAHVLTASAEWLAAHPDHAVLIEGHCDERGTAEYNLALGDRRARAARDFLVARGVAAARVSLISYGEDRPRCTERNEGCWRTNRRAHFELKRP